VTYSSPSTTGSLGFAPVANANGTATITVTVNDGGSVNPSVSQAFAVTVNPVNDAPSFTKGADQMVKNDSGPNSIPNWATGISAGPADESGQTLSFELTPSNSAIFLVPPAISPAGTLTFTPKANAVGISTVAVQLHDNGGTADGGVDTSAPQSFSITVKAAQTSPFEFVVGGFLTQSGGFSMTLTGDIGTQFVIESSADLKAWVVVATLDNLTGTVQFVDPGPLTSGRFYRAHMVQQ
jgi:hypothetical protein